MQAIQKTHEEDFRLLTLTPDYTLQWLTLFFIHAQVALYATDILSGPPIATSESMFVHNNSKHGRRPPYSTSLVGDGMLVVSYQFC